MNQLAEQEQEVRLFAAVFMTIFTLGFLLLETFPNRQQGTLLGVVFGSTLALLGASMAEERERERAVAQAGQ